MVRPSSAQLARLPPGVLPSRASTPAHHCCVLQQPLPVCPALVAPPQAAATTAAGGTAAASEDWLAAFEAERERGVLRSVQGPLTPAAVLAELQRCAPPAAGTNCLAAMRRSAVPSSCIFALHQREPCPSSPQCRAREAEHSARQQLAAAQTRHAGLQVRDAWLQCSVLAAPTPAAAARRPNDHHQPPSHAANINNPARRPACAPRKRRTCSCGRRCTRPRRLPSRASSSCASCC